MALTPTHLVLVQDEAAATNTVHVYDDADFAGAPIVAGALFDIPPPAGADFATVYGMVVHDDDLYVLSLFTDQATAPDMRWLITHVYRDVSTLGTGAAPDATLTHWSFQADLVSAAFGLAVDDGVLLATGPGGVFVNANPALLAGAAVPDTTLAQVVDLGIPGGRATPALGGGEAYFVTELSVLAFEDPANLFAGQLARYDLQGPSNVDAGEDSVVRIGDRLFCRARYDLSPIAVVGFDVGGPVADFAPPDVEIGPPVVQEHLLAGAGGALVCGRSEGGIVSVFARAASVQSGDTPDVFLYDPDLLLIDEVRVVER